MSGDKFWEQWTSGAKPGQPGEPEKPAKPADPIAPAAPPDPTAGLAGLNADALAAWLKEDQGGGDSLVPPVPPPPITPAASSTPSELAALWPPSAPVDPFAGIQTPGGGTAPAEWDLGFETPGAAPPPPPPAPAAREAGAPPAPWSGPGVPAAPEAPGGLGDFALDLGGGSPAPVMDAPPASPAASPFGPPLPPPSPPQESLQAPPLRIAVTVGRRTHEVEVKGEALIGRPDPVRGVNPEVDLRQDDAVSRRHAKIFIRDGVYVLTDLNSTNGTRHNQQWAQPEVEIPLKAGDEIEVGEITLIKVLEAPNANA